MVSAASTPLRTLALAIATDRLLRRFETMTPAFLFLNARAVSEDPVAWGKPPGGATPRASDFSSLSIQRIDTVLDETRALRHRVVEAPCSGVGLVGVPEDIGGAGLFRRRDDGRDQRPADARAPFVRANIEVLQIAAGVDEPGRALK